MARKSITLVTETRFQETRVALLPHDLQIFFHNGYEVIVETGAGEKIGYADPAYAAVGARIVSRDEAWRTARYIPKLLCITEDEVPRLHDGLHMSAFFYAGENYALTQAMCRAGVTAYSYEYFQNAEGRFPMMVPDGHLSGQLAVLKGAEFLQSSRGLSLAAVPDGLRAKVVVIGHGNVGGAAARLAHAMGADVTVFGRHTARLKAFTADNPGITGELVDAPGFAAAIAAADLVIGAILISSYDTPAMITEDVVKRMQPGAVVVDVTCGYGKGYLPSADKITMPGMQPYTRHGVLHYKNPRLPAMAARTGAHNASKLYAGYIFKLAEDIYTGRADDLCSQNGKIVEGGKVVHPYVQGDFDCIESGRFENYDVSEHLAEPVG